MMRLINIVLGLLLLFPAGSALAGNLGNAYTQVKIELAALKSSHPWAGVYNGPPGMSFSTIYLAPSGRFCNVTWWDMGGAETGECGRVRLDEDRLVEGWWAGKWSHNRRDAPPFLLIPWGARKYLIPESRIIDFINDVNAADEPRFGRRYSSAYLRSDGRDALVLGYPDVPDKYRALLLPAPLMTTAVEIGLRTNIVTRYDTYEDEDCGASATFDAGSSSGVFVGMKLHAQNGDFQADVVISEIAAGSSSGRIKQFDCDKSDPLPSGTRFSTRPSWQFRSTVSTEPLITEILFASAKRFPPIFGGAPEHFFLDDPYVGAAAEGFTVEPVATVKFRGPFPGALELKAVRERMNRTMLSLGGNMFAWAKERPDLPADEAGGIETKTAVVHRLSYAGEAVEPDHEFHVRVAPHRRGERLREDWKRAALTARAALCGLSAARRSAERAFALELLRWDEAALGRAHELRFEDLDPERRRAAEAFVLDGGRQGVVWPALALNPEFGSRIRERGYDAEKEFTRAHPEAAAECERLRDEERRRRF